MLFRRLRPGCHAVDVGLDDRFGKGIGAGSHRKRLECVYIITLWPGTESVTHHAWSRQPRPDVEVASRGDPRVQGFGLRFEQVPVSEPVNGVINGVINVNGVRSGKRFVNRLPDLTPLMTPLIEAAPQRDRQKHSAAEEPITARIRRRTAANSLHEVEDVSTHASTVDPPKTFQERLAAERQRKHDGPSPP